jgi:hypothetical protein
MEHYVLKFTIICLFIFRKVRIQQTYSKNQNFSNSKKIKFVKLAKKSNPITPKIFSANRKQNEDLRFGNLSLDFFDAARPG